MYTPSINSVRILAKTIKKQILVQTRLYPLPELFQDPVVGCLKIPPHWIKLLPEKNSGFVEAPTLGAGQWWQNPIKSVEKMVEKMVSTNWAEKLGFMGFLRVSLGIYGIYLWALWDEINIFAPGDQWLEDENSFLDGRFSGANCSF